MLRFSAKVREGGREDSVLESRITGCLGTAGEDLGVIDRLLKQGLRPRPLVSVESHKGALAQLSLCLLWLLPSSACSSGLLYLQLQLCGCLSPSSAVIQFQYLSAIVQKTGAE